MNKKVVILGGGTGLSALLRGIKYIDGIDISAIVTVSDSGGSTGILSKHFDVPAVGDLRRVIASLSKNRVQLEKSMEYRIKGTKSDLDGHTIGNLILISQIMMKKSFSKGIASSAKMLNIAGNVLPVSDEFNDLHAELHSGEIISGENNIGNASSKIKKVFYKKGKATKDSINAIKEADYVILGIGSLYTSLIANLIYPGIKSALKSTKGEIIYFANLFTQHGETDGMSLTDHVNAIENHTSKNIIDKIIVSNSKLSNKLINNYKKDNQELIKIDRKNVKYFDLVSSIKNDETGKIDAKHSDDKIENCLRKLIRK